jgi:hypothetical protein
MEVPWASALREFNPLCPNVFLYWDMVRSPSSAASPASTSGARRRTRARSTSSGSGGRARELVWEYWTADGRPLPDLSPKNPKFEHGHRRLAAPAGRRHDPSRPAHRPQHPMMEILFWLSAGVLLYVYAGYPLLLWLIVRLRGARVVRTARRTCRRSRS